MLRQLYSFSLVLLLYAAQVSAQHADHRHNTPSDTHGTQSATVLPQTAGQAAFATIQEIVSLLEQNPATDWTQVNITALREHLIDMHRLTLESEVTQRALANGAEFFIPATSPAAPAAKRMVPPHARELDQRHDWTATSTILSDGVRLTVTAENPSVVDKIQALGFYGLMAIGAHHPMHHLAIAQGRTLH